MEAEVVSLGIQVAQNAKCLPMIVELDSKEVVDLFCNRKGEQDRNILNNSQPQFKLVF